MSLFFLAAATIVGAAAWLHARGVARRFTLATAALAVRVERAAEEERARISRELHDDFGQRLVALKLQLQIAQLAAGAAGSVRSDDCLAAVDGLIGDVRSLSRSLRPAPFEQGYLMSALSALARAEGRRGGFCVLVDAPPDEDLAVSREAELACYRVVTEVFNNAVKHARARNVALTVSVHTHDVEIRVVDDGEGFDVAAVMQRAAIDGRLGLLGMQERVQQISGLLRVTSTRGRGTAISCRLPRLAARVEDRREAA